MPREIAQHYFNDEPWKTRMLARPMKWAEWLASLPFQRFVGTGPAQSSEPKQKPTFGERGKAA